MYESPLFLFFGRLHPMVLHAPIGLLIALAALEALAISRRRAAARDVVVPLAWLTAAASVLTALSGLTLAQEAATATPTLDYHKYLGIAVAVGATLAAVAALRPAWLVFYRATLLLTVGALIPAGHLGASMTHGENFLTEPFDARRTPANAPADTQPMRSDLPQPAAAAEFEMVANFFAERCTSCHGPERQRGGLALHKPDSIRAGGKHGPIFVAGKPEESELLRRLRLPLEDRAHMPPPARAQPEPGEIDAVERWIAAGATLGGETASTNGSATDTPEPAVAAAAPSPAEPEPDAAAIAALQNRLIHVEPLARDSSKIWIDCSAAGRSVTDAELAALLAPLARHIAGLGLARTQVSRETIAIVAQMSALTRLDLSGTAIDDADVARLAMLPNLQELVLTRTNLSDASVEPLQSMATLRQLYIWKSGLPEPAVARLRTIRPGELQIDAGDRPDAAGSDAETELKFSSDAPLPGQAPVSSAASLQPINATCPVSGTPVDPKYVVVWKGRAIGFCCPNCPSKFWADPAAFESKLPPATAAP